MTVSDLYKICNLLMFDKASANTYDANIIPVTNKILAEVYGENNMLRMFKGKVPLTSIPQCTSLSDELGTSTGGLGYCDEYLYNVIPKGICANLLMDDDLNKMSIYQTEYNNARVMNQVMVSPETIEELTAQAEE